MARIKTIKTNFTAGEIGTDLRGRGDLTAYTNGAASLRNVVILPTGGVTRRDGLRFIDLLPGAARLVAFEFNTEQTYLLAFSDLSVRIYDETETLVDEVATSWSAADLAQISWTQSADTLLLVHPEHAPKRLVRTDATSFEVRSWNFIEENGRLQQPHFKFGDDDSTLQPSATSGSITLTANGFSFQPEHVGTRFRLGNKEVEITGYTSETSVTADCKQTLADTGATKDWSEQVFSTVRGFPTACVFHQDRLVIGGSRDLPNRLWLSKSADLFNFDLGEGEDDESIEFAILSDQVNAVRAVFSGRHLQVFTSGAEWMVTGDPLTPTNIQLKRQTRVGSPTTRYVPPRDVDGATLFVSRNGRDLREFLFTDVEQAYQSNDLATLASHIVRDPIDQDYDKRTRLMHLVMADGKLASVTVFRPEKVTAWAVSSTDGSFDSVAVVDERIYVVVTRDGAVSLERFDPAINTDAARTLESDTPRTDWGSPSGDDLSHLEGISCSIVADGQVHHPLTVTDGAIALDFAASSVEVGRAYTHRIEPLPIFIQSSIGGASQGTAVRLVKAVFRLLETQSLTVDTGAGPVAVPFARADGLTGPIASTPVTVDKTVRALGWTCNDGTPLWRVEQSTPLDCTILSVMAEVSANG